MWMAIVWLVCSTCVTREVIRYSQEASAGEAVKESKETADTLAEKAAADVTYYPLPLPDTHIK